MATVLVRLPGENGKPAVSSQAAMQPYTNLAPIWGCHPVGRLPGRSRNDLEYGPEQVARRGSKSQIWPCGEAPPSQRF